MIASEGSASGEIFLYHAVVNEPLPLPDPCFTNAAMLRRQLEFIREHFEVVRLARFRELMASSSSKPLAAITFDDGFANNLTVALPILQELDLPATVFLCTDLVDTDQTVWFCRVNRAIAQTSASSFEWGGAEVDLSSGQARYEASLRVQQAIKQGPARLVLTEVTRLEERLGVEPLLSVDAESPYAILTSANIATMLESELIDFGAHTRTHAILSRLEPRDQRDEIVGSIAEVARLTHRPCRLFAYPNGQATDFDPSSQATLADEGIEIAVTTIPGLNVASTPSLALHRTALDQPLPGAASRPASPVDDRGSPLRILFAYHSMGLGGVETATLAKIGALDEHGLEAWVYFHRAYGSGGSDFGRHPRVMVGPLEDATLAALLDQGWDLISVIDYPELLDLARQHGIGRPIIYETHASAPDFQERTYQRVSSSVARAIVAPSGVHAERLRALAPAAPPIVAIPNVVDTATFRPGAPIGELPFLVRRPSERPLLWIGRLESGKNPEEAIEIARAMLARGLSVRLLMIGDLPGEYAEARQGLLERAGEPLANSIEWVPNVPHALMPDVYAWAAATGGALLSTSRYETQPMILLESMAAGCPVVATRVGGVGELIEDRVTGRLYSVGAVDEAATALAQILGDVDSTVAMTTRARDFVRAHHSPQSTAQAYAELINGLETKESGLTSRARPRTPRAGEEVADLVSVIIPVYNRPGLLREAVASVQAQTYRPVETILVDDGSEPATSSLCDELAAIDPSIRVLHKAHSGRPGIVREAGRVAARGEFIQYLDSDDLLAPRKLELMVGALRDHPEADIAYCYVRRYQLGERPSNEPAERSGEAHSAMLPTFVTHRLWLTACPVYRRRIVDQAGPWTDLPIWEDFEYDMRMAGLGARLVQCPDFLVDIRDHALERQHRPEWFDDPDLLRDGIRAHRLIHQHARHGGMTEHDEEMGDLLAAVRFIWASCRRLGLDSEAEESIALMREIAGGEPDLADPRLQAAIEPLSDRLTVPLGEIARLQVRVTNQSTITFRSHVLPPSLSYHVLDQEGRVVHWDGPRVAFSPPLRPGENQVLTLPVTAPVHPGRYDLELDLVLERVTWFKDAGSPTARVPLVAFDPAADVAEPTVSVVIPAYNQAPFLAEAIESVRWQTYRAWECVIVDDGSVDRTATLARALAAQDPRIRYHFQDNAGLAAARNTGLGLTSGKYVQFLDADDFISPTKLERQVELMERDDTLGVLYSNFWRFSEATGQPIDRTPLRLGQMPLEDFLFHWERGLTIPIHSALFRRAALPSAAPFDTRLRGREDWLFWIDLARRGVEMSFDDQDLAWYRIHGSNMAGDKAQMIGWLLEAAKLAGDRIPEHLRRPFSEATANFVSQAAEWLLTESGAETGPSGLERSVEELEVISRQVNRNSGVAGPTDREALIDQLRLALLGCRRHGRSALAARCEAALASLGKVDSSEDPLLRIGLRPAGDSIRARVGTLIELPVQLRNGGDIAARSTPRVGFGVAYEVRDEAGQPIESERKRVALTAPLRPGEVGTVDVRVQVPTLPGRYLVELDVVCEGVAWLSQLGNPVAQVDLSAEVT